MQQLSSTLSIEYSEDRAVLYYTRTGSPRCVTALTLTASEIVSLFDVLKEGRCPVCMTEIPLNDVVCNECFEKAQSIRR